MRRPRRHSSISYIMDPKRRENKPQTSNMILSQAAIQCCSCCCSIRRIPTKNVKFCNNRCFPEIFLPRFPSVLEELLPTLKSQTLKSNRPPKTSNCSE